jgi:EAL domain-containing protein (putative c-di-GMP-specific phosphodiesterase class I)
MTLLEHGCHRAQGFLLSRPLPADEMAAFFARKPLPIDFSAAAET